MKNLSRMSALVLLCLLYVFFSLPVFALEKVINGNFSTALGAEWDDQTPIVNEALNPFGITGGYFHGEFDAGNNHPKSLGYADGLLSQTISTTASPTRVLISLDYLENYEDGTSVGWEIDFLGTVVDSDGEMSPVSFITRSVSNDTVGDLITNWTTYSQEILLPTFVSATPELVISFSWKIGCLRRNIAGAAIDQVRLNQSPSGLFAYETPVGQASLDWNPSVEVAGLPGLAVATDCYRIYRRYSESDPWVLIGSTSGTSFIDSTLAPDQDTAFYSITDLDTAGTESPMSVEAEFRRAKIEILSVTSEASAVTLTQQVQVHVLVSNTGFGSLSVDQIDLFHYDPPVGVYDIISTPAFGQTLNGGDLATYTFTVRINEASEPSTDMVNASATATNLTTSLEITADEANEPHYWLIRSPAKLVVTKITVPSLVYRDQQHVQVAVEVLNDGSKNASGIWKSTELLFLYPDDYLNISALDTMPVTIAAGETATVIYTLDVHPEAATGTYSIDANITYRDENIFGDTINTDGAILPGSWTVVSGLMRTYKGPPDFPSYVIQTSSYNQGANVAYAKTENLQPYTEHRIRWYDPDGIQVRVMDPPKSSDENGSITDQYELDGTSKLGQWRVIATRVTNAIPLAEQNFFVVEPAQLDFILTLPSTVSVGQTFEASMMVFNDGGADVDGLAPGLLTTVLAEHDTRATILSGPDPAEVYLNAGQAATFTWQIEAIDVGNYQVQSYASGYDANDATQLVAATDTSNIALIELPAKVDIVNIDANHGTVYRNQNGLSVDVTITNSGEAAARVDSVYLTFSTGVDTHSFELLAPLPITLNGGQSAVISFEVAVAVDAPDDDVYITAYVEAVDLNEPEGADVGDSYLSPTVNWSIDPVAGFCSTNLSFEPEQYRFNEGQNLAVKFTGLAINTRHKIRLVTPGGALSLESAVLDSLAAGVCSTQFTIPAGVGQWKAEIGTTNAGGGSFGYVAELFFTVQTPGQLQASLSLSPSPNVELGKNITVTMSVSNEVANGSTLYPVIPDLPYLVAGYTGEATKVSGPDPASASVKPGWPATFTWVFKTTQPTDPLANGFAMEADVEGLDSNTAALDPAERVYSSASTGPSNEVFILSRDLALAPKPINLGLVECDTTYMEDGFDVLNQGNTAMVNLIWQKSFPTSGDGYTIPYSFFSFSPAPVFAIATGTVNAPASFTLTVPPNQPAGVYTTTMAIYDDINFDSSRNINEPYHEFGVQFEVNASKIVRVSDSVIDLGGWPASTETSTATLDILNTGNLPLDDLIFAEVSNNFGAGSTVYVDPMNPGALATDAYKIASVSAVLGAEAPGTYIATWSITDNAGGSNVELFAIKVIVGDKDFSFDPNPLDIGSATPTYTIMDVPFTIRNDGSSPIANIAAEPQTLVHTTDPSYTIHFDNISFAMPSGVIDPGVDVAGTVTVYIPAGTPVGDYESLQIIYDDENGNGVPDGTVNEPERTLMLRLNVLEYYAVQVIPSNVDFGGLMQGESKTIEFLCRNIGNMTLNSLDWTKVDLTAGAFTLPAGQYSFTPAGGFAAPPGEFFTVEGYIEIPLLQDDGNYTGFPTGLLNAEASPADAEDSFQVSCQVGNKAISIVEAGPIQTNGPPDGDSSSANFRVKNDGGVVLTYPKARAIAPLTSGANAIPASAVKVTPNPFSYLNPGQTRTGSFYVEIPPGQPHGIYETELWAWDDTNNNGVIDPGEPTDSVIIQVEVLQRTVIRVTPSPADLFYVAPGQTRSIDIIVQNTGNMPINDDVRSVKSQLNSLTEGLPAIPAANVEFPDNISTPIFTSLPDYPDTLSFSVSVTVPSDQIAGPYEGTQKVYVDADGDGVHGAAEPYTDFILKLTVGQKKLSVTPTVNLGSGLPGEAVSANFVVKNETAIALSRLYWERNSLFNADMDELSALAPTLLYSRPVAPNTYFGMSGNDSRTITATINIPPGQLAGVYTANQRVFEDDNANLTLQDFEASGTFLLQIEVLEQPLLELDMLSLDFGDVVPGDTAGPLALQVTNAGNVTLDNLEWALSSLISGGNSIDSANISITGMPLSMNPAATVVVDVSVQVPAGTSAGVYNSTQTVRDAAYTPGYPGENLELWLNVLADSAGPALDDAVLQSINTDSFSSDSLNPDRMILSAWVCPATSAASIGFYEAKDDFSEQSYIGAKVNESGVISAFGPGILDFGIAHVVHQMHDDFGTLPWFRIYLAFDYHFDESLASHTYIVLQSDPDDEYIGDPASHSVWFDGVQLEKAIFPDQTRPTSYSDGPKIVSPSQQTTLDGRRRYYEW